MGTTPQTSSTASQVQFDDTTVPGREGPAPSPVLKNIRTIADLEAKSSAQRKTLDRLSDRVSDFAGSTSFLLIHVAWFAGWITLNSVAHNALDAYPFTFLTFLVSLEAIFLTSFVLISQNHLEAQAHRRAALDLQINLLAEREMTSVLRTVSVIAAHLGLSDQCSDEELTELVEPTDVEAVAKTVEDQTVAKTDPPKAS